MDQGGIGFLVDPSKFPIIGEVSFTCRSTEYLWQVPPGITSITAVCVGGGGGGHAGNNQKNGAGGGGGGLRWINGLQVVPGEILRVKAGLGGTGAPTSVLAAGIRPNPATGVADNDSNRITWGRPGKDSYIASDNNASVPARTGIGDTIIVLAQGGGKDGYVTDNIRIIPTGYTGAGDPVNEFDASNAEANNTVAVGRSGGQGSTFGNFDWGTIGGGNGGDGGIGEGVGGGQDGGGGGAGGWFGNGGEGGTALNTPNGTPTDGQGGAGGGGMFGGGGGADASGGGGGVGVFWGNGPNGKSGYYFWDGSLVKVVPGSEPPKSNNDTGFGGQGGSFGADGRATGSEIIDRDDYFIGSVGALSNTNHANQSNGNGKRGYNGSVDDSTSEPFVIPNGGDYGGGGGAAQTAGGDNDTPSSGDGGCGHVRILFVARNPFIIREYGGERTVGTGAADETRTINGESVTVRFRDFDPGLSIANNLAAGWPAWNPTPQTGVYYNLLVNYASNVPFLNEGFLPAAVGISTTQF